MGQGRFGHDRILSGVIVCHVVGNNGVFPERGSRGPCVGFWVPGSIWQRMWYFCAKFLWIKGVFYHGLCVIIYAGRIVPCLHWHLIRVIGRMTSLEWFSIWETSNNIINFNDVRKRLWKLVSMMMFSPCVFCVLPNTPLFPTTWHTITPDKIRSWPNRPCPINQSESILNNQWKSRISDQSGHRIPHQLNLIGY